MVVKKSAQIDPVGGNHLLGRYVSSEDGMGRCKDVGRWDRRERLNRGRVIASGCSAESDKAPGQTLPQSFINVPTCH